ncbi:MAG: tail fiber domain-containing protein [Planctomycetota bacterium]
MRNYLRLISIGFFLVAIGLFSVQLFRTVQRVYGVVGTLNITGTTGTFLTPGGIWHSSGNVGIGTTGPDRRLEIQGGHGSTILHMQAYVNGGSQDANLFLWASEPGYTYDGTGIGNNWRIDGGGVWGREYTSAGGSYIKLLNSTLGLGIVTSGGTDTLAITINSSGNVGIGTAAPSEKLEVSGNIKMGTYLKGTGNIALNPGASSYVDVYTTTAGYGLAVTDTSYVRKIYLTNQGNISATGTLTISGTGNSSFVGNVGIGITAPAASLHVKTAGNTTAIIDNGGSTYNSDLGFYYGSAEKGRIRLDTNGNLSLWIGTDVRVQRFTLDSFGNVGIGTTSPGVRLHAYDSSGDITARTMVLGLSAPNSSRPSIQFSEFVTAGTTDGMSIEYDGTGAGVTNRMFINSVANAPVFTVMSGGNVGIGTTSPTNKLDVNGTFRVRSATTEKDTNTAWTIYSDARLKDVVGNYNHGLAEIMKINPIFYTYKENNPLEINDPGEHIGIIAQDVQSVIPEAITLNKTGYLQFTADPVLWAMVNAIKEQQTQITTQQKQIEELKKEIEKLKK